MVINGDSVSPGQDLNLDSLKEAIDHLAQTAGRPILLSGPIYLRVPDDIVGQIARMERAMKMYRRKEKRRRWRKVWN